MLTAEEIQLVTRQGGWGHPSVPGWKGVIFVRNIMEILLKLMIKPNCEGMPVITRSVLTPTCRSGLNHKFPIRFLSVFRYSLTQSAADCNGQLTFTPAHWGDQHHPQIRWPAESRDVIRSSPLIWSHRAAVFMWWMVSSHVYSFGVISTTHCSERGARRWSIYI